MENQNLLVEIKDGVALLTVNRPTAMNALNSAVIVELTERLTALGKDDSVKVIVITGSGNRAFVAGADIAEMAEMTVPQAVSFARAGQSLVALIGAIAKPVIAAVNGFALGGGLELALACDFIYASENAKMGLPEVTLGVMPGFGGTQKLARAVGRNLAKELVFTGKMLTAAEGRECGLVNAVFAAEDLVPKAVETAGAIARNGLLGVACVKDAIDTGLDMGLQEGMGYEAVLFGSLFATADQKEGMRAFLDKRKAAFSGN
jgi:enoyl-CoA hydratase